MKYCHSCEIEKDESQFYKRKASNDGLAAICKVCQKVYDKARSNHAHRVEARAIYAQTDEGKLAGNRAKALYRQRNPEKAKAHAMVARRIRAGHMTRKPCEKCGATEKIHAHHDDYSKPLDVRWLCPAHHKADHMTHR